MTQIPVDRKSKGLFQKRWHVPRFIGENRHLYPSDYRHWWPDLMFTDFYEWRGEKPRLLSANCKLGAVSQMEKTAETPITKMANLKGPILETVARFDVYRTWRGKNSPARIDTCTPMIFSIVERIWYVYRFLRVKRWEDKTGTCSTSERSGATRHDSRPKARAQVNELQPRLYEKIADIDSLAWNIFDHFQRVGSVGARHLSGSDLHRAPRHLSEKPFRTTGWVHGLRPVKLPLPSTLT